jgi:acylphosphatase
MATKPDITKHLEAILGHKLTPDAVERIKIFQEVASSTFSEGSTITRSLLVAFPDQCRPAHLLDVSGFATTGSDGKIKFLLTGFLCETVRRFLFPINVVATPLSTTPCFLTVRHILVNDGTDVEIQVSTWGANGMALPSVSFDWRCRAEFEPGVS